MTVDRLKDLDELAVDVRDVAVKHQRVAVEHLPGVVEEDVLGLKSAKVAGLFFES